MTYTGYNIIGAVVILPMLRHVTRRRDAVIAGMLCGPLAMIPAIVFFVCMAAFHPQIGGEALPSNFLLERLDLPVFQIVFQRMIFAALLESGVGGVHAINERVAASMAATGGSSLCAAGRLGIACCVLILSVFVAERFGLVALIANGYRWLAYVFLAVYVVPLLVLGSLRVFAARSERTASRNAASCELP